MTATLGIFTTEHVTSLLVLAGGVLSLLQQRRAHKRIVAKIDENTAINAEQINVSNHVNEKIVKTNEVAIISGQELLSAIQAQQKQLGELQAHVSQMGDRVETIARTLEFALGQRIGRDDVLRGSTWKR